MSRPVMAYWVRLPGRWRATSARVTARLNRPQLPSSRLTSAMWAVRLLVKLAVTAAKIRTSQRPSSMTRSMPARRSRSTAEGRSRTGGRAPTASARAGVGADGVGVGTRAAASTRNLELGPAQSYTATCSVGGRRFGNGGVAARFNELGVSMATRRRTGVATQTRHRSGPRSGRSYTGPTMTRSLVLSNGRLHVNLDEACRIRDVYYPQVGFEHHAGQPCRLGFWSDGVFAWFEDFERSVAYESDTLVTQVVGHHPTLGIEVHLRDAVDFEADVLIRQVEVRELTGRAREVRVFAHHDLNISGTDVGDTTFF